MLGDLEENQEEVEQEVDKGEMLVLRRFLSGQRGVKDEQSENIFHSGCMVHGKVCFMVANGGSCTNIVSLSMIEKLCLQARSILIYTTSNG